MRSPDRSFPLLTERRRTPLHCLLKSVVSSDRGEDYRERWAAACAAENRAEVESFVVDVDVASAGPWGWTANDSVERVPTSV